MENKQKRMDALTKFYLPCAADTQMDRYLKNGAGDGVDTTLLIEIDYKQFMSEEELDNSMMVAEAAYSLTKIFDKTDLFVRVGPAAFFVYAVGYLNEEDMERKLKQLIKQYHQLNCEHAEHMQKHMHVGVYHVQKETGFMELLHKASTCYEEALHTHVLFCMDTDQPYPLNFPKPFATSKINTKLADMEFAAEIMYEMYDGKDMIETIPLILRKICAYFHTQYIYEIEREDDAYKVLYECRPESMLVENENLNTLPLFVGDNYQNCFMYEDILACNQLSDMFHYDSFVALREKIRGARSLMQGKLQENRAFIGYICMIDCEKERIWTSQEIATFFLLIKIINTAILQMRMLRQHHQKSSQDTLTKAWNLKKFYQKAVENMSVGNQKKYALITMDIKNFKYINSEYGYAYGDRILVAIVEILNLYMEDEECFARIDADIFILLLNYEDIEKLKQRLNLLIKKIERYNIRYDLITNISCMLGIYLINDITMDIAQMIDYANTARKSIKDSHESCIAFYNGKLEEKFIREHRLSSIMRQSLKNHEFIVFYQPKVNIYTNQCVGVEALVRWRRQDGNMIYPSEFIPLFEKNHFIIDLDMYVLEQVCIQINTWIKQGKKPLPVSVNISRVDLKNNDIVKQIVEICDTYQINRSLIELEITESAFLENESIAIERSKELKAEGFLLSIDDFGTGFSSLSLLKDLPMDVLKLDHTFFQTQMNKREKIILTNIIRMAKQLDMTIVSEGIETRQHVAFLKTIGCEIAQGFYYARPNEINQLDLWGNFEGEDVS